jgi:lipopolysaccharide/colanic/teichoic acid biosynthesis glycosyltransferase
VALDHVRTSYADIGSPLDITSPLDIASSLDAVRPPTIGLRHLYRRYLKRIIDILVAFIALALLWPLLVAIAVLVKIDSSGPALFVQTRIGKGGRPFRIYKFRTMSHGLDDSAHRRFMQAFVRGDIGRLSTFLSRRQSRGTGPRASRGRNTLGGPPSVTVYKPFGDSQVTRVGRILRKTSLDELPQLLNVLTGQMSLIGPRPNVPWEVEAYKSWHRERLNIRPGITGLAQVEGRSAIDFDTIARHDIAYVRRMSLGLDLRIILKTVSSVFSGNGAH